ncbi:MAG: HAMP domain-containing histidine kinase [Ardenticatenaceae bacterium]|nr:HAMP domain-containing histidine kinase [Ardenticatenaceae bacterium]MCB8989847.1 HAMP domain-containing histidine kinase [Ardenticatenaceae bacterium]
MMVKTIFHTHPSSQIPLRWRLTIWYLLTLGAILLLFAAFLYWQLQRNLYAQVDTTLQLAASQAFINVDADGDTIAFQNVDNLSDPQYQNEELTYYLLSSDGVLLEQLGQDTAVSPQLPQQTGYVTLAIDGDTWRVYSQLVTVNNATGWVQVVQNLDPIVETLERLLTQMTIGVPLALALAGIGGLLLASSALRPIVRITQTAQSITGSDLNRRIHYQGPTDELGRLAQTFDDMLDRLQAAFERERRFTGDAAHELRTPLAALKGRIGVTLSKPRPLVEYTDTLHEMEGQVDRLIHLSNDLLFMARLDQRQMPLRLEPIALPDFLAAVVDQVSPLAEAKQLELYEHVPDHLFINGDIDLLIRLFLNLLDNAIKYTPEGGQVSIAAQMENQQVRIAISDTGTGISKEHLPHLFERFYRVEEDRTRSGKTNGQSGAGGAGLGLAIAYEIVRAHKGNMTVESQPNQGTTFIVQLPA